MTLEEKEECLKELIEYASVSKDLLILNFGGRIFAICSPCNKPYEITVDNIMDRKVATNMMSGEDVHTITYICPICKYRPPSIFLEGK